ncbi:MAG: thioredoxin-dependent thiol peroxidase [Cytophagales bacterium]|nr:thioredoxin-dependent thiol peroxidase [Bernardetiaceae bacterium]MDW8210988.1 thioredoxin-dependent thiol peroxidase [Cytophagales bacterium]
MALQVGMQAPDFEAKNHAGELIRLSDLRGKKVVLYFYPKDDTPGCTAEACNLRDNYSALQAAGYEVIGVSTDSPKSHTRFKEKYQLPFQLIADEDKTVHQLYQAWVEKKMYGKSYMGTARITYIIDQQGIITDVIEKVDTKNHAAQILKPEQS